ncbi:class I SAM-dependent methyltransferase [Amycolatopsis pigmentata]|uniref:Class I SAM-dependent methyltransferase n=1 Tax=Amycolatopsis pigmentata TaxID=450801 RepID=A0ABW5G0U9_9PSEU
MRAEPSERLALFLRANDEEEAGRRYPGLLRALVSGGKSRPGASEAAREMAGQVLTVPAERSGHLVVLLGLLAECGEPELRRNIRAGLDHYLKLLGTVRENTPLGAALVYLLAHFPEDAASILPVARSGFLDQDDLSRLERCLAVFTPETPAIGRSWPSPARWRLSDAERDHERRWLTTLTRDAVVAFWEKDTRTLLAYMGAKAAAAISTRQVESEAPDEILPVRAPQATGRTSALFDKYAPLFRCPACGGRLVRRGTAITCRDCAAGYLTDEGYLDLSGTAPGAGDQIAGNSPLYLSRYEPLLRPAFLRVNGTNWSGAVSIADEDAYLIDHVRPAAGPLLDLGAGTGRWTKVLASHLGGERIIAFDLAAAMVRRLGEVVPDSLVMRGAAGNLPFADGTLGAVNCWNTIQSIETPYQTIHEIGRCLGRGGTFTMLTYRHSPDPLYRYFQQRHESCLGVTSFDPEEMREALSKAGMTVMDQYTPGSFLIITAVRR